MFFIIKIFKTLQTLMANATFINIPITVYFWKILLSLILKLKKSERLTQIFLTKN